jgi:hypothetical protein
MQVEGSFSSGPSCPQDPTFSFYKTGIAQTQVALLGQVKAVRFRLYNAGPTNFRDFSLRLRITNKPQGESLAFGDMQELVWQASYQPGGLAGANFVSNQWHSYTADATNGIWYVYRRGFVDNDNLSGCGSKNLGFQGAGNQKALGFWVGGGQVVQSNCKSPVFSTSTRVAGIQIKVGSTNLMNSIYVDDVELDVEVDGTTTTLKANFGA